MDILQEAKDLSKKSFINHVFSSTDEDKAELLNIVQYAVLGFVPVVILNKTIQRFIPEADPDKSSLEIIIEILIQMIVIFCGIIVIHRVITFFPTYSGFKYENMVLTNVILAFLIIVLSIQSKMGIKANIIVDRISELWNGGERDDDKKKSVKNGVRVSTPMGGHAPSQADFLDNVMMQGGVFPPAPTAVNKPARASIAEGYDYMMRNDGGASDYALPTGPMAANSVLGGSFGSAF
jgi:hypothetical protein